MSEREKQLILKCINTFRNNCSDELRENWKDVIYDLEGSFLRLYKKAKSCQE